MNEDRPLAADAGETRVDLRELARRGAVLDGSFALASMSRLASALSEPAGVARVRWTLRAQLGAQPGGGAQPVAELEVDAEVPLQRGHRHVDDRGVENVHEHAEHERDGDDLLVLERPDAHDDTTLSAGRGRRPLGT